MKYSPFLPYWRFWHLSGLTEFQMRSQVLKWQSTEHPGSIEMSRMAGWAAGWSCYHTSLFHGGMFHVPGLCAVKGTRLAQSSSPKSVAQSVPHRSKNSKSHWEWQLPNSLARFVFAWVCHAVFIRTQISESILFYSTIQVGGTRFVTYCSQKVLLWHPAQM